MLKSDSLWKPVFKNISARGGTVLNFCAQIPIREGTEPNSSYLFSEKLTASFSKNPFHLPWPVLQDE